MMHVLRNGFEKPGDYSVTIDRAEFGLPEGRSDVTVQISDVMEFLHAGVDEGDIPVREFNRAPLIDNPDNKDKAPEDRKPPYFLAQDFPETVSMTRNQAVVIRDSFISFYRPNDPAQHQRDITDNLIPVPDVAA